MNSGAIITLATLVLVFTGIVQTFVAKAIRDIEKQRDTPLSVKHVQVSTQNSGGIMTFSTSKIPHGASPSAEEILIYPNGSVKIKLLGGGVRGFARFVSWSGGNQPQ
ncbi:MAG TPA: hypothetical protein VM901_07530 [Bdellovibrionota bacterium]|nr:hypothetical protein [Bdellovibrionota bacterium]